MNRVLNKRIFRDLKENFLRYIALFLMIVMGMYIITAMVGAAETIITGTAQKAGTAAWRSTEDRKIKGKPGVHTEDENFGGQRGR